MKTHLAAACILLLIASVASAEARIVRDDPGWPVVFELDRGETFAVPSRVNGREARTSIKLISTKLHYQPDLWAGASRGGQSVREASVAVEVNGKAVTLRARPYEMPRELEGIRLYVEATREWNRSREMTVIEDFQKEVRFSAVPAGSSWGPTDMAYPIANYRWRSSTYNNTWAALVPYNRLYYHAGEDMGAVPDRLDVRAILPGTVTETPLPRGDGKSNGLRIEHASGLSYRLAHMNIESIDPALLTTSRVFAGQALAKTGMTWSGRKSQTHDHHLHVEFGYRSTTLSTYPFLVEAYLRDYPNDHVLAVAGGYHFALPGQEVELDSARTVVRAGQKIASVDWKLSDGRTVNTSMARRKYDAPGLYSEELVIHTEQGEVDRDYAQVRVWDPQRGRDIAYGWAYHTPTRGIAPGDLITFHNRLINTRSPVIIDFGDGSEGGAIQATRAHRYTRPGVYTVTLTSTGPMSEPVTLKMRVNIEREARPAQSR